MELGQIGKWAFIAGLVIVLLTGFVDVPMVTLGLFVIGLIVGFLNVTAKETDKFLIATMALILLGLANIQNLAFLGTTISTAISHILESLIAFAGASALVVAVKAVIEIGQQ